MPLTRSSGCPALSPFLTVGLALGAVVTAGVVVAGHAAALEDPRRPTATVTHGPSCGPAVVRVQVTNGTEPHRVALVFDGVEVQDAADLDAGEQAELTSQDVDWGVTVDVSLMVADPGGSIERPLQLDTYTRPSEADCAAVVPTPTPVPSTSVPSMPVPSTPPAPSSSAPAPSPSSPPAPSSAPAPSPVPSEVPPSSVPAPSTPAPVPPTETTDSPPATGAEPGVGSGGASRPSDPTTPAASVSPGGVLTVRAGGFTPGEPVDVRMSDGAGVLGTVTAAADGSVEAVVQIPRGAALGAAALELVGSESAATAGVDLQVAARAAPVTEPNGSPAVLAAGLVLLTAAGSLGLVGMRRSRGGHSGGRR